MKFILFIFVFLWTVRTDAYLPSPESLFRNHSNGASAHSSSGVRFKIYRQVENFWAPMGDLVVNYQGGSQGIGAEIISNQSLRAKFMPLETILTQNNEQIFEQGLFLSILQSLIFNNGYLITSYLKKLGVHISTNQESLNQDRDKLIQDYLNYLKSGKHGSSPIVSSNSSENERLRLLMVENPFKDLGAVSLHLNQEVFWKIDKDGFIAHFTQKEHLLKYIEFQSSHGLIKYEFKNHRRFNGVYIFPQEIEYFNGNSKYRLSLDKIDYHSHLTSTMNAHPSQGFVF